LGNPSILQKKKVGEAGFENYVEQKGNRVVLATTKKESNQCFPPE
jgi:hypothetical protein